MPKPVAVAFADAHLQEGAWVGRDIRGDSYKSFEQIIDYAVKHQLPLIGAGDLLDRNANRSHTIHEMLRCLDKLNNCPEMVRLFVVQGQHELDDPPWFTCHKRVVHLPSHSPYIVAGLRVFGIDFQPHGQLQEALQKVPISTDILVCHQVWGEFMGELGSPQGNLSEIARARLVITGDYHVPKALSLTGADGKTFKALSPGSTCMQSIDEPPAKYFLIINDNLTCNPVRLDTRNVLTITINSLDELDHHLVDLAAKLEGMVVADMSPLLRVTYSWEMAEHGLRKRVLAVVGNKAHIFWKEVPREKPEALARRASAVADGQRRATTLESALPDYLQSHGMQPMRADCQRLLTAESPRDELARMRAEALK